MISGVVLTCVWLRLGGIRLSAGSYFERRSLREEDQRVGEQSRMHQSDRRIVAVVR